MLPAQFLAREAIGVHLEGVVLGAGSGDPAYHASRPRVLTRRFAAHTDDNLELCPEATASSSSIARKKTFTRLATTLKFAKLDSLTSFTGRGR